AKITLMEDDVLIAPAPYTDPSAYYFPTLSRMEGIEVLKGSSQIQHGPYTIGGALNLLTTPIPTAFRALGEASYGSFGTNRQRILVGASGEVIDYLVEADRNASAGFKVLDNGASTGFDRRDVMAKLRWHSSEQSTIPQSLSLKVVRSTEDGNESYLGLTYKDYLDRPTRRYAATQRDRLRLEHTHVNLTHSISPVQGLTVLTTAYHTRTFRDWSRVNSINGKPVLSVLSDPTALANEYVVMTGQASGSVGFQSAERTFISQGVQASAEYTVAVGDLVHKVKGGLRYHYDDADRFNTLSMYSMKNGIMGVDSAGPRGGLENQVRSARTGAAYLMYSLTCGPVTVTPGVRLESIGLRSDNYGTGDPDRGGSSLTTATNDLFVVLPGIGLTYDFDESTTAFAGVHKGFSPPGMPGTSVSGAQAMSETAINYELGVKLGGTGGVHAEAVVFVNDYANILGSDNVSGGGFGTGNIYNAGAALTKGVEFGGGYDVSLPALSPALVIPVTVAYTFTDARFSARFQSAGGDWGTGIIQDGDVIPFIAPHQLTASTGIRTADLGVLVTTRYTGATGTKPRQGAEILPEATTAYNDVNTLPAFWQMDISASVKLMDRVSVLGTVNNVTDIMTVVANLPQGFRPPMPRSFMLGVRCEW
ncbi:MAG: TonB-dependent receptor family protein, partial [Candidatus Kapaibacterium sp.]